MPVSPKFLVIHFIYPLTALIVLSVFIHIFDIDKILADYLYGLQGNIWVLKDNWLTEQVLHKGGHTASHLLAVVVIGLLVLSHCLCHW